MILGFVVIQWDIFLDFMRFHGTELINNVYSKPGWNPNEPWRIMKISLARKDNHPQLDDGFSSHVG